jgi:type IV secretion system protein VirB8
VSETNANLPAATGQARAPSGAAARAHYYATAATWAQDNLASLRKSRRTAWILAGTAAGIALAQAIAIMVMLPLKQPVPYTITVDRETGYVQTARGVNLGAISETEAVSQSFVAQYVLARETFDINDYRENYRKTMLWSQGPAEAEYLRDWDRQNPVGIQNRYRATTQVQVTIKSVTILGPRSALIRFDTEQTESGGGGGIRQPWAATVGYSFSGKPLSERDRYLNPLGFQVNAYRRDAETAAPVNVPAPPLPAVAPAPLPAAIPPGTAPAGVDPNAVPTGAPPPVSSDPATGAAPMPGAVTPQSAPANPPPVSPNPRGVEFPAQ